MLDSRAMSGPLTSHTRGEARDESVVLLTERVRLGMWLMLLGAAVFALTDLRFDTEQVVRLYLLKLANVPFVLAGTSQAAVIPLAVLEAGMRRERLLGSAPEALAHATRAIVAMEAGCSPSEVGLTVLGTPPSGFVVPWSDASIGGYALERVLTQVQLTRLEARVARLWPPGPFALGAAAARVVEGVVGSSRRAFTVLAMLGGEFGVRGRVGAVPAVLAASGIVQTRVPPLNTRERVRLEIALGA